jgi:hypothetical protein
MWRPETTCRKRLNPSANARLSPVDITADPLTHGNVDEINGRPERPANAETEWWVRQGSNL